MGYDEEDTVGYVAARDRLLRALDCSVFLAVSGIEWRAVWFLFQGLIRFAVCATVSAPSNLERPKMPQSAVQRFTERRLSLGNRRHDAIVKKFEEFLEKHPDRQLYLPEICSAIGSCERTTACEEHFGMGPIRYLTCAECISCISPFCVPMPVSRASHASSPTMASGSLAAPLSHTVSCSEKRLADIEAVSGAKWPPSSSCVIAYAARED